MHVLRSFSYIMALRFVEKIFGFITAVIVFRTLSVEDVATYNFFISTAASIAIFSLPEMQNACTQSVARGFYGTYRVASTISVVTSLLASIGLICVASYYQYWADDAAKVAGFLILALFFPASSGLSHWRGYFQGRGYFKNFAIIEMCISIARIILVFISLIAHNYNLLIALTIFLAVPAIFNIILTAFLFAKISTKAETEHRILRYGFHASLFAGIAQFANQFEKIILFLVSPAAMAIFVAGERWSSLLQSLAQDVAAVMGPKFARRKNYDRHLDKRLKLLSWGLGAVSMFIAILVFPLLIPFAFGESYRESVLIAQSLSFAAVITYHSSFRFRYIKSQIDIRNFRNITLLGPIFRIFAAVPLVYFFGIWGAIFSVFLSNLIINLTISWSIRSHFGE
jgi:O-antigen/teichoic acid export membrane protein